MEIVQHQQPGNRMGAETCRAGAWARQALTVCTFNTRQHASLREMPRMEMAVPVCPHGALQRGGRKGEWASAV